MPRTTVKSVCPYCAVGCGLIVSTRDGEVEGVRGDPGHAANYGRLCVKGALLAQMLQAPGRLLRPKVRESIEEAFREVSWDEALAFVAGRFAGIRSAHGPDALAFYGSGQLMTEDYYLLGKLAKGFIGTNNQDTNSRLCMTSSGSAYAMAFGQDGPPAAYADIDHADCVLILGANMEACHPVLFQRLQERRRRDPNLRVIVVDPRRTRTSRIADLHLSVRPGTDVALLNSMLHEIVLEGLVDEAFVEAHTEGWESLRDAVRDYSPERVAAGCGVEAESIREAALTYGRAKAALSFWAMGANQSVAGVDKNLALINLALATGNIGHRGAGPFSLTGQPNAMGGREAGGMAHTLPGHRLVGDAGHRAEIGAFWGIGQESSLPSPTSPHPPAPFPSSPRGGETSPPSPLSLRGKGGVEEGDDWKSPSPESLRDSPSPSEGEGNLGPGRPWGISGRAGLTAVEMFEAVGSGEVRGIWIIATNPVASMPDGAAVKEALSRAEVVVVQDAYEDTETAAFAHVLLPAAQWSERDGTMTNAERRVCYLEQATEPPGEALPDWQILCRFASKLGYGAWFDYACAEEVFEELKQATAGRDLDMTGMTYDRLRYAGGIQWPMPLGRSGGATRLYGDGIFPTASGRARFHAVRYRAPAEATDADYPFVLTTGRVKDHWHTRTRTGKVAKLVNASPGPFVEVNVEDARDLGVREGQPLRIESRRGAAELPARLSRDIRRGTLFAPMHWGESWSAVTAVNLLTHGAYDPVSKEPELKHCAVRVGWP